MLIADATEHRDSRSGVAHTDADFEPLAIERRYPPPKARINPDASLGWIRRIWPLVWAHKALLTTSIIAAVVGMSLQVTVPAVLRLAIDDALPIVDGRVAPDRNALMPYVVVIVILGLVRGLISHYYRYGLYRIAYRIEGDLRTTMYDHLTRMSFSFYDRMQSGQLISRANSDIRSVQMCLVFAPLMGALIMMFFVAVTFMLRIHVPLTLVALAPLPIVYFAGLHLRNRVFPLSWIQQSRMADVATIVDENINGVRVVKSFAAEEAQIAELAKAATKLQWVGRKSADLRATHNPIIESMPKVGLVAVLAYGGSLVIDGTLSLGTIVAFNSYILLLQAPFRMLGTFMMMAQRAAASADRIFEILDTEPDIVDAPGAVPLAGPDGGGPEGRVVFDHVTFAYPVAPGEGLEDAPASNEESDQMASNEWESDSPGHLAVATGRPDVLARFNLLVEPGEAVAIVGRTGSGKSTVARLLLRFYEPDHGVISVDGHDVSKVRVASLRHRVAMVLDEPFLFSESVRANIAYGVPLATDADIEAAARAAQAHGFISDLSDGYETVIGERGYTLSGGQRQRIAIARTLLMNPTVLILDDATSAIDVTVESAIHEGLETLMADRTTIIIAHRLSTIALADRVVLLENGAIAASGTHEELMANEPRYAEVLASSDADLGTASVARTVPKGSAGAPSATDSPASETKRASASNRGERSEHLPTTPSGSD